jgi:hypothetical protein
MEGEEVEGERVGEVGWCIKGREDEGGMCEIFVFNVEVGGGWREGGGSDERVVFNVEA